MVLVASTETRGGKHRRTRTDSAPLPLLLKLHRDVSDSASSARTATSLQDAFASVTEATDNVARSLWKNRALASSMNAWPPLGRCLLTGRLEGRPTLTCTAVKDGNYCPTVARTALATHAPRLATPARLEGQPRALLHPKRLVGAHEAIRADFVLFGVFKTPDVCGLPNLRG